MISEKKFKENKIEYQGKDYTVMYQHLRPFAKNGNLSMFGGVTSCRINVGTKEEPSFIYGASRCHSKDLYNKELGRKISYGRLYSKLNSND